METDRELFNFFNKSIVYDYKNLECLVDFNIVRKYIIKRFHETIPVSRILFALSIIDVMIFKMFNNEIDDILNNLHDLRENIIYMISFEKTTKEDIEE